MAYEDEVSSDSPTAWWKLNESAGSGSAADSAGTYTGTATNVTFGVDNHPAGIAGPVADFNGTSSRITSTLNRSWTALTVEGWGNFASRTETGDVRIISSGTNASNSGYQLFRYFGNADAQLGNTFWSSTGFTQPADGWAHWAVTWDGTTGRFYFNGSECASTVSRSGTLTDGYGAVIGCLNSASDWWNGYLCQVAVYDHALTGTRVGAHYTAGTTAGAGLAAGLRGRRAWPQSPARQLATFGR